MSEHDDGFAGLPEKYQPSNIPLPMEKQEMVVMIKGNCSIQAHWTLERDLAAAQAECRRLELEVTRLGELTKNIPPLLAECERWRKTAAVVSLPGGMVALAEERDALRAEVERRDKRHEEFVETQRELWNLCARHTDREANDVVSQPEWDALRARVAEMEAVGATSIAYLEVIARGYSPDLTEFEAWRDAVFALKKSDAARDAKGEG